MSFDQLTSEDALRLAVLLAGEVHAVRIDDGAMQLHALTPRGEARVTLHPDTRAERYLTRVREALAGHAMGSPGGYPVHLRRWTRSGHANPKNLAALLRLGEPEAVTAVALSAHLTDELARRAWWAQPDDETARSMLGHDAVRRGSMGPVLARHLLEHLAFEEDADTTIASVRAVAAAGLLDAPARERLWRAAQHRPHYLIGWLEHAPLTLPPPLPPPQSPPWPGSLPRTTAASPHDAALLLRCLSAEGQGFVRALRLVLDKLPTHDAALRTLGIAAAWFAAARGEAPALANRSGPSNGGGPIGAGRGSAGGASDRNGARARLAAPEAGVQASADRADMPAAPASSHAHADPAALHEALARAVASSGQARAAAESILARTTAVGPLMRRHLAPVLQPLTQALRTLGGGT